MKKIARHHILVVGASPEHGLQPWSWVPHWSRRIPNNSSPKTTMTRWLYQVISSDTVANNSSPECCFNRTLLCPVSCFAAELHCQEDSASPTGKSPAKSCFQEFISCNIHKQQISMASTCSGHDTFAVFQETQSGRNVFGLRINFSPVFLELWLGERRGHGQGRQWNTAHFVPAADTFDNVRRANLHTAAKTQQQLVHKVVW